MARKVGVVAPGCLREHTMARGGGVAAPGYLCCALWLEEEGQFHGRRRGGAMRGGGVPDRARS
jgi:hypothetical protein